MDDRFVMYDINHRIMAFRPQIFAINGGKLRAIHWNVESPSTRLQHHNKRLRNAADSTECFSSTEYNLDVGGRVADCLLLPGFVRIGINDFVCVGRPRKRRDVGAQLSAGFRCHSRAVLYSHRPSAPAKIWNSFKALHGRNFCLNRHVCKKGFPCRCLSSRSCLR